VNRTLTAVVGYGWSEAAGDYILNAAEEAFARRRSRSPFWRELIARAQHAEDVARREPKHGPATWTFTAPADAAGEQHHDPATLHARIDQLHPAGHATVSYRNNL